MKSYYGTMHLLLKQTSTINKLQFQLYQFLQDLYDLCMATKEIDVYYIPG